MLNDKIKSDNSLNTHITSCENLFLHLPLDLYCFDQNMHGLFCSESTLEFLGLKSLSEFKGVTIDAIASKNQWSAAAIQSFKTAILEVIKTGQPKYNIEEPPRTHADGRSIYFLTNYMPILDPTNKVISVVASAADITTQKTAEQQLLKSATTEQNTTQYLEILAGNIAHELRTPLAIIGINTDNIKFAIKNLAQNSNSPEKIKLLEQMIANIKNAVSSGAHAIEMILMKIRSLTGENSHFDPDYFTNSSIAQCITNALAEYPFSIEERASLHWDPKNDFIYYGDDSLTKHIIYNLLKNALYFIHEAGKGEIYISLKSDTNYNYLVFKDTARGMAQEMTNKIFTPFAYADNKKSTGLGLAFCKLLMQAYNGTITCNAKTGKYTEFLLQFPKTKVSA